MSRTCSVFINSQTAVEIAVTSAEVGEDSLELLKELSKL